MTDLEGEVGQSGFVMVPEPELRIRATFHATDGRSPEEVVFEWKHMPTPGSIEQAGALIIRMSAGDGWDIRKEGRAIDFPLPAGFPSGLPRRYEPDREVVEQVRQAEVQSCPAVGPAHYGDGHGCVLPTGHQPVEPGGRQHRCRCGGIFATDDEVPDVPGREEQERRRGRGGR